MVQNYKDINKKKNDKLHNTRLNGFVIPDKINNSSTKYLSYSINYLFLENKKDMKTEVKKKCSRDNNFNSSHSKK